MVPLRFFNCWLPSSIHDPRWMLGLSAAKIFHDFI
jgi:hypothetical protein